MILTGNQKTNAEHFFSWLIMGIYELSIKSQSHAHHEPTTKPRGRTCLKAGLANNFSLAPLMATFETPLNNVLIMVPMPPSHSRHATIVAVIWELEALGSVPVVPNPDCRQLHSSIKAPERPGCSWSQTRAWNESAPTTFLSSREIRTVFWGTAFPLRLSLGGVVGFFCLTNSRTAASVWLCWRKIRSSPVSQRGHSPLRVALWCFSWIIWHCDVSSLILSHWSN